MECICLPSFFKEFSYLYPPANWWCRPCTPGDYCVDNQNLSCPLHASSTSLAQSYVDCFCDPAFKNSTNRTEQNFCEVCPANSYCTGRGAVEFCVPNAIAPVQSASYTACTCDLGWKGVNNTQCVACQSPTYCYGGVQAQCSEGTFSTPLAFDRLNCSCSKGFWGPAGGPCIMCSSGKYSTILGCIACSNTTDTDCSLCELGTASNMLGRNTTCDVCEAGKYSHPANQRGALTCEWCGIGLAAPAGSGNCTTCGNGGFAVLGASACGFCTAGTFAVAPASACTNCGVGFYAVTGASTCTSCLAGQFAAGVGSSACTNCSAGYFASGLTSTCTICPTGKFSVNMATSSCQDCAAGTYSSALASSSSATCVACQIGTYSPQRTSACTNCPANSWNIVQMSRKCTANTGFYNLDDSLRAYYPFNEGDFLTDVTGWTGNLMMSQSSPTSQASGPFGSSSFSAYLSADTGFWNQTTSQFFTLPSFRLPNDMSICTWYWVSPLMTPGFNRIFEFRWPGQDSVFVVVYGSYTYLRAAIDGPSGRLGLSYRPDAGLPRGVWRHTCLTLSGKNANFWIDNVPSPFNISSPRVVNNLLIDNSIGKAPSSNDRPWIGAFDEFRIYHKALSPTELAALYAFRGDTTTPMIILPCPNPCPGGTYGGCLGDGTQNCSACEMGMYSSGTGQTSASTCKNCLAGTYSFPANSNGALSCEACGNGLAAPERSSICTTCGVGFYAAAGFSACEICSAGTFATGLVSACSVCAIGMYASQMGATACQNCSTCAVGQYNVSNCNGSANVVCGTCSNPIRTSHAEEGRFYFTGPGLNGPSSCPWYCTRGYAYIPDGCWYCTGTSWCLYGVGHACPANSGNAPAANYVQTTCKCNAGYYGNGGWSDTWLDYPVGTQTQPPANWSGVNCEVCPAGKYNTGTGFLTSAGCVSCVAGTYSTGTAMGTSASCISCQSGTYSTGNGMINSSACQNCSVCQTGQYNVSNCNSSHNTVCGNCSNPLQIGHSSRYYFTGPGYNGPSSCPWCCLDGMAYDKVNNGCWGIGRGNGWAQCGIRYDCPANSNTFYLNPAVQSACTCIPGFYGVGGWSSTIPLMRGQISPPANWSGVNCESCQAGKYNTGTGVTMSSLCTSCITGTYSTALASSNSSSCTNCITGTYSTVLASPNSSTCLSCQSGTYQTATGASNSSQCTLCHAGTYFTGAGAITSLTCQTCLPGKFSTSLGAFDAITCQNCEAGTFATISGAVSSSICSSCAAGTFAASSGSVNCSACLSGTFSLTRASACATCSLGTFSNGQASTCAACQPGYFALDGAPSCTPCPPGSFNGRNGSSNCSLCEAGLYSYAGMSVCSKCPAGTYKQFEACYNCLSPEDDCQPCFPGSASTMLGRSTQCDWCKAGTYSYPPNTFRALTCQTCENGTVASYDGAQECSVCVLGKYAPANSSACLDCPFHTYLEQQYKGSVLDCQACGPGTFSFFSGVPSRFACIGCSAGTYESSRDCIECPSGTFTPQDTFTSCIDCNVGKFAPGLGNTWCQICPLGKFTPAQSSACQDCPFHTYLDIGYKASVLDCLPCPAGTYSLNLAASSPLLCTPCLRGTYELNRLCLACASGTYSSGAQATACLQCLGATYSQSGSSSCTDCPAASYFDIVNFTCRPCNPGYYSTGGTSFCLECPVGAFSPSNSSACSNCLAGSYTGLNASLSCDLCEPATFSSSMGSSSCVLCPDGTFTNESGQPECLECTNGTYSSQGSIQVSTRLKKHAKVSTLFLKELSSSLDPLDSTRNPVPYRTVPYRTVPRGTARNWLYSFPAWQTRIWKNRPCHVLLEIRDLDLYMIYLSIYLSLLTRDLPLS